MTPEEKKIDDLRKSLGNFSKEEIIEICTDELKKKGYIFLKDKFPKTSEDAIDLAIPDLINSSEFIVDPTPFQKKWVVRKNPNYKKPKWQDTHYFWDKFIWAVLPAILGLLAGLLITRYSNQLKSQTGLQSTQQLKEMYAILSEIQKSMHDTLAKK